MRSLLLLSAFLLAATLSSTTTTATDAYGTKTGAYHPIRNLSDPLVQAIARFAVAENNKQTNGVLELSRVVSGEEQVVSGKNYRLILETSGIGGGGGVVPAKYEAVVWDRPWTKTRKLISFHRVNW